MKTVTRQSVFAGLALFAIITLLFFAGREAGATTAQPVTPAQNQACAGCHAKNSPALVMEWQRSRHAEVEVGCLDCHAAETNRIGAWKHEGMWITTLVTPKDCGQCHEAEVQQFSHSHHAKAGEILASLDNVLAEKVARHARQQGRRRQRLLAMPRHHRQVQARRQGRNRPHWRGRPAGH